MPRASRRLAEIFADVRSGLSPDRHYTFTALLGLCRRRDPGFGYSTLHGLLAQARSEGQILHLHRNTYAVPNAQGCAPAALPMELLSAESSDSSRLLVIEEGVSLITQQQMILDKKLDHLLALLREIQGPSIPGGN